MEMSILPAHTPFNLSFRNGHQSESRPRAKKATKLIGVTSFGGRRSMGNPVVLKNLSKRFLSLQNPQETCLVVDRINLELREGELLTMVGPRGCGKSTILNMIAGLEQPTEGEIYVDGHIVEGVPTKARNVGFLGPGYALFEHMTVADNISFGFDIRDLPFRIRRRRFDQIVTIMGLEDVLDCSLDQLSQGQQRLVALARILAPRPRVLLLDDPFSGLDSVDRQQLRVDAKLWQRELNIPTIWATHDRLEALEMGERIAVLDGGRFQQIDSSRNLFSNPANAFVAQFIGSENMLPKIRDKVPSGAISPLEAERKVPLQMRSNMPGNTFLGRPIQIDVAQNI